MNNQPIYGATRRRVRRVQGQAKFVGWLYLLGTIALAALSFLALMAIPKEQAVGTVYWEEGLSVTNFWKPFKQLFDKDMDWKNFRTVLDWYSLSVAFAYAFVLLTGVVNVMKAFGKMGALMSKTSKSAKLCNRNMRAMEKMGKIFAGTFAAIVCFHLFIYIITPQMEKVYEIKLTAYAYILLCVGLAVHFFAGLLQGKVSNFSVDTQKKTITEEKRKYNLFVYFVRNLVQFVAIAAILYFLLPKSTLWMTFKLFYAGDFKAALDLWTADKMMMALDICWLLAIVFMFVLVKHATAATEFNRKGIDGKGMKNFAIFSFLSFLAIGAAFTIHYLELDGDAGMPKYYLFAGGVALAAFLFDVIVKSKRKKVKEPKKAAIANDEEDLFLDGEGVESFILSQTPEEYYAKQDALKAQQEREEYNAAIARAARMAQLEQSEIVTMPVEEKKAMPEIPKEHFDMWEVTCPICGKRLAAKNSSEYHRCPGCGKVFQIRIGTKKSIQN